MDPRTDRMTEEGHRWRLNAGLDQLERWSSTAAQADKDALYKALFAVSCGTVFRSYTVLDVGAWSGEFLVLVRPNLALQIRLYNFDEFAITYIGEPQASPDQDPKPDH